MIMAETHLFNGYEMIVVLSVNGFIDSTIPPLPTVAIMV